MATPDWVQIDAEVAEQQRGYTYTTIAKLTATQIVLANGSRYRLADIGKVGEKGPYFGANSPTYLMPASRARSYQGRQVVADAVRAVDAVGRRDMDPITALGEMQAAIDEARRKLAEINR